MPDTICATGKVSYMSRHAATKSRGNQRNKGRKLRAYFCPSCHSWHLTTQTGKETRE